MITVHCSYAKRRLHILNLLSISDGRIGRHKRVKQVNWYMWNNFVNETVIDEEWPENFRMSRTDRFKNLLKNWEWIRIHVEGQIRFEYAKWEGGTIFESAKKDMRIQKYPDTCERGWAWVFLIAPPFFLFGITDAYVLRSFVIVHEQSLVKHIFSKVE